MRGDDRVGSLSHEPGFYRSWVDNRRRAETRLPAERILTQQERRAVFDWSTEFADWGLRAVPSPPVGENVRVVEIYGPDNLVPGYIIYPSDGSGYVLEAFDGARQRMPTVDAALAAVAA
jgi:hypothetical protein